MPSSTAAATATTSSSDDELIQQMTDALTVDSAHAGGEGNSGKDRSKKANDNSSASATTPSDHRRASETSLLTSATSTWFTNAGSPLLGAATDYSGSNSSSNKKKSLVVGGGQGLFPPVVAAAQAQAQSQKMETADHTKDAPTAKQILKQANACGANNGVDNNLCDEIAAKMHPTSPNDGPNVADDSFATAHTSLSSSSSPRRSRGRSQSRKSDVERKLKGMPRRRSGSPVETFCANDLPTALEAMEAEVAAQARKDDISKAPIDEIDPARIKMGKKMGAVTGMSATSAAPSVVSTNCADSGSTDSSPIAQNDHESPADTFQGDLKDHSSDDARRKSRRNKSLSNMTDSASTVAMSNVHELANFLAEAEEAYDAEQERKSKIEAEKLAAAATVEPTEQIENISDDEQSLDLAQITAGTSESDRSTPKRRGSKSDLTKSPQRSYPSVTRHQYNSRKHQDSSGSLGANNDSQQTFSSLKKGHSSSSSSNKSSSFLKRQASMQSNHSSSRSVQFKDDVDDASPNGKQKPKSKSKSKPAPPSRSSSFEATADMYREKYARCKNRSLWANLDRSIDTNVIASAPTSAEGGRTLDQQEKANQLLRRRVRMCFAAMTVVFGGGKEEDPVDFDTNPSSDLNESFTSLAGDDVSVRSGMSGMTQLTSRSTATKKSRRSRHRRHPSGSSQSTIESKKGGSNIPSKRRPSIPVGVVRLLFAILIRRRGGLDLDDDFTQAVVADNASAIDSEKRAQLAEARIDAIVDDVIEAMTSTLGLVDSISSYDADDPTTSGRSEASDRRRNRRGSLATDSAAIASRASSLASADSICLFINHNIHMLYGQATASYRPEIFFADTAAFHRFLYKNHTTGNNDWDPEVELNYEMADACLGCIRRKHSADPIGAPPNDLEYVYSLEAVPLHLLRCGRYHDLGILLSKESYVRRKLRKLGSIDGVKAHIADVSDMNEVMANVGNNYMDMSAVFVASFTAMYEVLKTTTDQAKMKASKSRSQRYQDRLLSLQIQSAEAFHAMGVSLQEHGFEDDAVDAYSHAMENFVNVEVMIMKRGIGSDGRLLCRSSSDESLYLPSIDHVQFIMAETLVGMARVYDEARNLDAAMESYEKALSLYSKQRSLRHRSGVASTLTTMGVLHFRKKDWNVAMACFDEALVILQSLEVDGNRGEEIGDIYQWQGNIKREIGDYQSALALFTEAFYTTTLKYGKMHPRVGRIHQSMAIIHDDLGDFKKSMEHYQTALKIRKRAVSEATRSDDIKAFEVATVEELAVAETLMCMGNVYRVMEDFSKAYDCYLENSLIMRLDVTALLGSAFLSTHGILGLLIGDEGSVDSVNILYNRLMMTLDMARRVELQGKESLITGNESDSSFNDNEQKYHRSEQVAECLFDVGVISASRYLKQLDNNTSIRTDQIVQRREEALSCFEEVISVRQERIAALDKLFRYDCANDRGQGDEEMIIAYSLYEVGHLLSCTFFSLQQRDPSEPIDGDLVSRDISAALAAFADSKRMFQEMNLPHIAEDDAKKHVSDPLLARATRVPEVLEEMTQTMALLYRETGEHDKALEMYTEQLQMHENGSADSGDARDDASYFSIESRQLSREEKVAQAIEDIGDLLRDQGDTQRALEHYLEALEIRSSCDETGLSVAKSLRLIGRLHLQRKEFDLAVVKFEEELKILIDLLDENSSSIAYCFHSIGKAYEGKNDFGKALDYFQRARKTIGDSASAESDIQYTHVMFDTGNVVLQKAKTTNIENTEHELALKCLKGAFEGYTALYGETCVEAANTRFLQGELFYSNEEYETGISCFEEALRIYRTSLGEENIKIARTLNLIGLSHLESGSDEDYAMECFDACLAILQSKGHEGSEDHACVLFYKAAAHEKNEQLDLAIVCYEGSVGYYRKLLGSDAMKIAVVLEKLGTCLLNFHEPEKAKDKLEEALRIRKKHRSDNDQETAEIYYGLGIAYCEEKEFNKSLDAYEKCFLLRQELFGESHIEVAQVLNNVGSVFARAGEYERALSPWNDALAMYRDAGLKENNERIVTTLSNIALSRNLISVHKEGDSIIRTFLIY